MTTTATTTTSPLDFVTRLLDLTHQEQVAEQAETALLVSNAPWSTLEARGLALSKLTPARLSIGLGARTLVTLKLDPAHSTSSAFPPHSFRPGDLVQVLEHSSRPAKTTTTAAKTSALEGVVYQVADDKLVVALGKSGSSSNSGAPDTNSDDDVQVPQNVRLLKLANPSTSLRQKSALRSLSQLLVQAAPLPPLISVLLGLSNPSLPSPDAPALTFIDETLNESQRDAARFALDSPEVALIWGPPGTGKTQTLVEVVRQLVSKDQRVLVCGGSNLSVDNLLQRLSVPHPNFPTPIPLTRLGHPARVLSSLTRFTLDSQSVHSDTSELVTDIKTELEALESTLRNGTGKNRLKGSARKSAWNDVRELRKDFRQREGGIVKEVLSKARVVLATTHGAGGRMLERMVFDVVIIDEAAQAVEPSCWIPILKGRKLILAGDHLQLPPTIKSVNSFQKSSMPGKVGSEQDVVAPSPAHASRPAVRSTSPATSTSSLVPPASSADLPDQANPLKTLTSSNAETDGGTLTPIEALPPPTIPPTSASVPPPPRVPVVSLTLTPTLELTLFSRLLALHGPSIRRMLKVQYRFSHKIGVFPSERLYNNELVPDASVASRALRDLDGIEADEDLDEPVVFIDTAGLSMFERAGGDANSLASDSKQNENEAAICVAYVEQLIDSHLVPPACISLISPYQAQVQLLASLLHPRWPAIEVGSIDGQQGRENEVIILSLVRSNEKKEIGFLGDERRLNVAMTRAKRQLVVVGDSQTVAQTPYLKAWMRWLENEAFVKVPE